MAGVPKLSRRTRWAIPVGALVVTGAVLAGSLISVAQASPGLPSRTPAQLLAQVADSVTPPLTGTVVETTSLGLPSLPGTANPTSIASLLTGSHTVRVWYSGPRHFPLAVPLRLQFSARGAGSPASQGGHTSIQFVTRAPADLTFTPPPGATVTHENLSAPSGSDHTRGDVTTIGSGWLAVLDLPSAGLTAPGAGGSRRRAPRGSASRDSAAPPNPLLPAATPGSGARGRGRPLRASPVPLLLT